MPASPTSTISDMVFSTGQKILMGLIFVLGPVSTDMYLPAFPALEHDLGHGTGSGQITLTAWLAGLAIGQFALGPLFDRHGRKTPLLIGLTLYIMASIALALTTDFTLFCILRFVAAIGGATTSIAPRAMVRDVATGAKGVSLMSQLLLVFGLGPLLAPSIGSFLLDLAGWRSIFWAGAVFGLILLVNIWFFLPDTLPLSRRYSLPFSGIISRYRDLITEPLFFSAAMVASFGTFTMFTYLSNGPALYENILHFSPHQFAILFSLNGVGFIIGSQINARLTRRFLFTRIMEIGMLAVLLFSVLGLAISTTGFVSPDHPWALCLMIFCAISGLGFVGSNAGVLALTHHGHQAGSAAALIGTLNWTVASMAGVMMSLLPTHFVGTTSLGMIIGIIGCLICDLRRRHLDPAAYLSKRP